MSPEYEINLFLPICDMKEVLDHHVNKEGRLSEADRKGRYGVISASDVPGIIKNWEKALEDSQIGEPMLEAMHQNLSSINVDAKAVSALAYFKPYCPDKYNGRYSNFVDDCVYALKQLTDKDINFDKEKGEVLKCLVTHIYDNLCSKKN